jgi:putative SOS response-associated peptidase YedK
MCDRFLLDLGPDAVFRHFGLTARPALASRSSFAPMQRVAAVRSEGSSRWLSLLRWGLLPSWAKSSDLQSAWSEVEVETTEEDPAFRFALKRRRCLIPATGFLKRGTNEEQPCWFRAAAGGLFAFAGLWDCWHGPGGDVVSCVILTTTIDELMRPSHERMPVVLPPEDYGRWLNAGDDLRAVRSLLTSYPSKWLTSVPVDPDGVELGQRS